MSYRYKNYVFGVVMKLVNRTLINLFLIPFLILLISCNKTVDEVRQITEIDATAETPRSTINAEILPPVDFNATALDASVKLTWSGIQNDVTYAIYRSESLKGVFFQIAKIKSESQNKYSHLDINLKNGTTYYYKISLIISDSNYQPESKIISATPVAPVASPTPPPTPTPTPSVTAVQPSPPKPPTEFTAIAGNTLVNLSWGIVPEAKTYLLKRSTSQGKNYVEIAIIRNDIELKNSRLKKVINSSSLVSSEIADSYNTITYQDQGLLNGTRYYYIVQAVSERGTSRYSNEVNAMPQSPIPPLPAPQQLVAIAGNAEVTLSWQPVALATFYILKRSSPGTGFITISSSINTMFVDTGLMNGTTFHYIVYAANNTQTSANSNTATVSTPALPSTPILNSTTGNAQASLSWNAIANVTGYRLYRRELNEANFSILTTQTATSYLDTSVINNYTYYYYVVAENDFGVSPNSNTRTVNPLPPPSVPVNLIASPGNGLVNLSWSESSDAVYYRVKRSLTSGSGYTFIATVYSTEYTNNGLTNGTTYYYVVEAVNTLFTSGNSVEKSVAPLNFPTVPSGLKAESGNDALIVLTWDVVSSANYYAIYRSNEPGYGHVLIAFVTSPTFTDTGLVNDSKYYYFIQATNQYGISDPTAEVTGVPAAPPEADKNVLIIYNSSSVDSITAKDYYLAHRPGFNTANILGVNTPDAEIISNTSYVTTLRDPIVSWLTDPNHSSKSIRYIVLLYGIATRVLGGGSIGVRINNALSEVGIRQGASYGTGGSGNDQNAPYVAPLYPGTTALVSHVGMATLQDTLAYIDKLALIGSQMQHPNLILSAEDANLGGLNYEFDDAERVYPFSRPGQDAAWAVSSANNSAQINYQDTNHITYAENVRGYQTWGANGGQGGMYALNGSVVFSGQSNWYIINTIESFNGQKNTWQGHWTQWFSQTAFGGSNYESTPIFAIGHTEEPYLGGALQPGYFKHFEQGYLAIECAWATRATYYYLVVGDPLVKK